MLISLLLNTKPLLAMLNVPRSFGQLEPMVRLRFVNFLFMYIFCQQLPFISK